MNIRIVIPYLQDVSPPHYTHPARNRNITRSGSSPDKKYPSLVVSKNRSAEEES